MTTEAKHTTLPLRIAFNRIECGLRGEHHPMPDVEWYEGIGFDGLDEAANQTEALTRQRDALAKAAKEADKVLSWLLRIEMRFVGFMHSSAVKEVRDARASLRAATAAYEEKP